MSQDSIQSRGDYFPSDSTLRGIGCRLSLTFSRVGHLSRRNNCSDGLTVISLSAEARRRQSGEPSHILLTPTAEKHSAQHIYLIHSRLKYKWEKTETEDIVSVVLQCNNYLPTFLQSRNRF